MSENKFQIKSVNEVPAQRICDLLAGAFDGGIGYWARIEIHMPDEPDWSWCTEKDKASWMQCHKGYVASMCGGHIFVIDTEEEYEAKENEKEGVEHNSQYRFKVEREDLIKGMQIMSDKYPRHFNDFINENDDACTGDVFVQCCVFGDITYG